MSAILGTIVPRRVFQTESHPLAHEPLYGADTGGGAGDVEIVRSLEIQTILRRYIQGLADSQCGVRRDGTVAADDLVDSARWRADGFSQAVLGDT